MRITTIYITCENVTFPNIQAVIFDKDGTLADSQAFLIELANRRSQAIEAQIPGIGTSLLMAFGVQDNLLDPTGLMAVGSRNENEIAAAAYIAKTGKSWFEAKQIAHTAFAQADLDSIDRTSRTPLFHGSREILKSLSDTGLKIGILSADSTAAVKAFVEYYQLSDYIQLAMGVEGNLTKPNPKLFLLACQELGVEPHHTLMIGDSQGDIEMAKKAGAAGTIGIYWGNNHEKAKHLKTADILILCWQQINIHNLLRLPDMIDC